jgi:hypothetical protein
MQPVGPHFRGERARSRNQEQQPAPPAGPGEIRRQPRAVAMAVIAQNDQRASRQGFDRGQGIALALCVGDQNERRQGAAIAGRPQPGGVIELARLLC